jgi:hypothetical protein
LAWSARRFEIYKPEGFLVIFICRRGTILIFDECPLGLGVVVYVGDEGCGRRCPAQIDIDLLQKISFVERRAIDAFVRRGDRDGAIKRVIGGGARKHLGFERGALGPVGRILVAGRELARAAQGIAFEVVMIGGENARAVEMLENFRLQIRLQIRLFPL